MLLCEEYLQRHKIKVPFVKFPKSGFFIVRTFERNHVFWSIYTMDQNFSKNQLGHYLININQPVVNSSYRTRNIVDAISVDLNEYESYVLKLAKGFDKKTLATTVEEATLMLWEMYVYSLANVIVSLNGINSNICTLHASLDYTKDAKTRYENYQRFLNIYGSNDIFFNWRKTSQIHLNNYCYWIAEL